MINYTKYKKFYTNGGEFLLNNENYIGEVEINDGDIHTYITNYPLTIQQSFASDILASELTYDRLISDIISLPYTLHDINVSANDYLTYNLISDKLKKLHINNSYVYSRMFIPNNDLPSSNNVKFIGLSGIGDSQLSATKLDLYDNYNQASRFNKNPNFIDLGNITHCVSKQYDDNTDTFNIFGITSSSFVSLSTNSVETNYIEISNKIETIENELTFGKLENICLNDTHVFISDSANNVIIKYEVAGYYNNDKALANKRNLIELIGGTGSSTDPSRFNTPTFICCNNNDLLVYDSGNYVCKIFSINFNYKLRLAGPRFKSEPLAAAEFDKLENRLYVLTYYKDTLKVYIYDSEYKLQETYVLEEKLVQDEKVNNIAFSNSNNNYWHICTNFNVYQHLKNRPDKIVGRYQAKRLLAEDGDTTETTNIWNYVEIPFKNANFIWNKLSPGGNVEDSAYLSNIFKSLNIMQTSASYDNVILLTPSRIYIFEEPYVFKRVTKAENYENYGIYNFSLSTNEYIQASTINKEVYKIISDLLTIQNNLIGRFTGNYDSRNIFTLTDYNYNVNLKDLPSIEQNQYYIHENEKNILGVVNRVLSNIYKLQYALVNITNTDYGSKLTPVFTLAGTLVID